MTPYPAGLSRRMRERRDFRKSAGPCPSVQVVLATGIEGGINERPPAAWFTLFQKQISSLRSGQTSFLGRQLHSDLELIDEPQDPAEGLVLGFQNRQFVAFELLEFRL